MRRWLRKSHRTPTAPTARLTWEQVQQIAACPSCRAERHEPCREGVPPKLREKPHSLRRRMAAWAWEKVSAEQPEEAKP